MGVSLASACASAQGQSGEQFSGEVAPSQFQRRPRHLMFKYRKLCLFASDYLASEKTNSSFSTLLCDSISGPEFLGIAS